MARLYRFIIKDEKIKSLEDFMTQSQDGLSPTVHKGYIFVRRKNNFYEMHFTISHPLELKDTRSIVCYSKYPIVTLDTIFYPIEGTESYHN